MRKSTFRIAGVLVLLFALCAGFQASGQERDGETQKFDLFAYSGPRMKDLYYVIIRDMDAALLAISAGKLDVLSDIYRSVDIERLSEAGGVNLSIAASFHGFFITFNTRKFPWDHTELRQAASQVIERRKWVRDLFSGYCEPMRGFLPMISPFHEPDITLFPQGEAAARKRLSDAGWTWNRSGWLVAPDGREVSPVRILCPPSSVVATTTEIASLMAEALRSIGVPAEAEPMDFQTMLARVDVHDFDVCTNAWTMSRDPDVLYAFYHSSMDVDGGYNLSGVSDPKLDEILTELRYAPDEKSARGAASRAQKLLSELMPVIPLYSRYSISATRGGWDGVFTTDNSTSDNLFTMLSMTPEDGTERPIYWNISEEIRTLNPLISSTAYDWAVLGTVYDTLLGVDPYTFEDIPWLAEKWNIERGERGSVLSFTLRDGLKWQDGRPLTVEDAAFSIRYIKDNNIPRFFDSVKDVESVEFDRASRSIRVTMGNVSYWHLHNIGGGVPLFPKHILEKVSDWRAWQPTNRPHTALDGSQMTELVGSGPFIFRESRTGEYIHMTRNENYFLLEDAKKR
ncbi:MAG: ABC transporter substrate-binding protein [Synergistaceae bacterium]|jgi:peptide/nickel transport system substrate-binding protein|nr:ABC transporter substrate-binding protein [Synergistaceae bacterium]